MVLDVARNPRCLNSPRKFWCGRRVRRVRSVRSVRSVRRVRRVRFGLQASYVGPLVVVVVVVVVVVGPLVGDLDLFTKIRHTK